MFTFKTQHPRCLLLSFLFMAFWYGATCQDAPVTTAATIADATPGTITVPLTVTGFDSIAAISLTLEYDYAVMTFIQGIKNPSIPGNFAVADSDVGNGFHRITMGWFGSVLSLPDSSSIMDLEFTYITGVTTLEWIDYGGSCEYADGNYMPLNDIPTEEFYINGFVCGILGAPGPVSGNDSVCQGQAGEPYSISPVVNATGYEWSVPEGVNIITGQNTNAITVDFSANAVSGPIAVYATNPCSTGLSSILQVTVNITPLADAGTDFSIPYGTSTTLYAAPGGSGTYSYHWSPEEYLVNPDVQDPQTVILTSTTVFTVQVTNLDTYCQSVDDVTVTITGGPLSVNPVALPSLICQGESAQLYSNAGGGSGNYTYQWTCEPPGSPPWSSGEANPLVTPDSSKLYLLMVYDGFTTTSGSTSLTVAPLPTATISGGDTLCGEGNTIFLPVDLTGSPPWDFTYTYGNSSVFIYDQYVTPYYIVTGEAGTYFVSYVEDAHCTGTTYGSAEVHLFPIPATPEITYSEMTLTSNACCGNQWYLNDQAIPGATDQTYHVTESGWYYDIVTLNGCSSEPSETIDVIVGIKENEYAACYFYPNPATDRLYIRTSRCKGLINISLCSIEGRALGIYQIEADGNNHSVDISNLGAGLYFVKISGNGIQSYGKLVIR